MRTDLELIAAWFDYWTDGTFGLGPLVVTYSLVLAWALGAHRKARERRQGRWLRRTKRSRLWEWRRWRSGGHASSRRGRSSATAIRPMPPEG